MIKKILIIAACSFFSIMQISAVNIIIDSIDVGPETKGMTIGVYSLSQDGNYNLGGSWFYEEAPGSVVELPVVCGAGSILYLASGDEAYLIYNTGERLRNLRLPAPFESDLPPLLTSEVVPELPQLLPTPSCARVAPFGIGRPRTEAVSVTISMPPFRVDCALRIEWIDPGNGTENISLVFFRRKADGSYIEIFKENFEGLHGRQDISYYYGSLIYVEHNGRAYYIVHEGDRVMRYDIPELLGVTTEAQERTWRLPADCAQGLPSQNLLDVVGNGLVSTGIVLQRPALSWPWGQTEPFLYDEDAHLTACF